MILYFADKDMNVLGATDKILSDKTTKDIDTGVASLDCVLAGDVKELSKVAAAGNRILLHSGGRNEVYTIVDSEISVNGSQITVYAEDAGLSLINIQLVEYPSNADVEHDEMTLTETVERYLTGTEFEIGANEDDGGKRNDSYDEQTLTERLREIATNYGYEVSYSFTIEGLKITHKYVNFHKRIGADQSVTLRYGHEVNEITVKTSVENLATGYLVYGSSGDDGVVTSLAGVTYDDGDYYVSGHYIYSRTAVSEWGKIIKLFNYDTVDQSELLSQAIKALKTARNPEKNYEVETVGELPGVSIGDTVRLVAEEADIVLSARVLKTEVSETSGTNILTLGDYLILDTGISQAVLSLTDMIQKQTENAKQTASTAITNASGAVETSKQAAADASAAKTTAEAAAQSALTAKTDIEDTRQWFWHDSDGAHVESLTKGSTDAHYRTDIIGTGMQVVETGSGDTVAEFGASGATIGKADTWHITMESDGYTIYEGTTTRYRITSFADTDPTEAGTLMRSGNSRLRMYESDTTGSHTELLTTATNDTAITSMRATEINYGTEQSKAAEVSKTWFGVTGDGDSDDSSSIDLSFGTESAHHVFGVDNAGNVVADGSLTASNSATYRLVEGGGPYYVWMDCRDSSNAVQNNMVLASAYTSFRKAVRAPGYTINGATLLAKSTVTVTMNVSKTSSATGSASIGTKTNYLCIGVVQIVNNHSLAVSINHYAISGSTLAVSAYNHTSHDLSLTLTITLLWLHYGMY